MAQVFRNINRAYYTSGSQFSNAFNPRDLLNLKLWLDGNQGITTVSGKVSNWVDKSGRGNDVAQGVAGNRPTYNTNPLNSLPTLAFSDAGNTWLLNTSRADLAPNNVTMTAVARYTTEQAISFIGGRGDTGNAGYWISFLSSTPTSDFGNGTTEIRPTSGTATVNVWGVYSATYDGAHGTYYTNGTSGTPLVMSGNMDYTGVTDFYIGQTTGTAAGRTLTGDIAEVILYSTTLSTINRRRLEKYLGRKYGLTVV